MQHHVDPERGCKHSDGRCCRRNISYLIINGLPCSNIQAISRHIYDFYWTLLNGCLDPGINFASNAWSGDQCISPADNWYLMTPMSCEEIDTPVASSNSSSAPGPDGFNVEFYLATWEWIGDEVTQLVVNFYRTGILPPHISDTNIALIPKKENPDNPNDFRPISLVSIPINITTKLLANRAQQEVVKRISKNQYGFIKSRNIQDCLAWSFEYIHMCHKSKKPSVIFKVDFEKAFDTIEHEAIFDIFKAKGFGDKWISWMKLIFSSASSVVMLN